MKRAIAKFDKEWREGDRSMAKEMAKAYVADNRGPMGAAFDRLTRDELVGLVTQYRNEGTDEKRLLVDMWLLAGFEPQQISGSINIGPPPENGVRDGKSI